VNIKSITKSWIVTIASTIFAYDLAFAGGTLLSLPVSPRVIYRQAGNASPPELFHTADGRMRIVMADRSDHMLIFMLAQNVWTMVTTETSATGSGHALPSGNSWMYATLTGYPRRLALYSARGGSFDSFNITTGEDEPVTPTLANGSSKVFVAYRDARRQELKGAFPYADRWEQVLIDKNGNAGEGCRAISLSSREIGIAYLATVLDRRELRYAQGDASHWRLTRVDLDVCDSVSLMVSLAVAPDGTIGIAYYKAGQIMYAFSRQSSWKTIAIPDAYGIYPDLAFDSASRPYIAFYADLSSSEGKSHGLALSVLENGRWISRVLDSRQGYGCGITPSIAFDASGNACIAYQDSDQDQKLLKLISVPASTIAGAN